MFEKLSKMDREIDREISYNVDWKLTEEKIQTRPKLFDKIVEKFLKTRMINKERNQLKIYRKNRLKIGRETKFG